MRTICRGALVLEHPSTTRLRRSAQMTRTRGGDMIWVANQAPVPFGLGAVVLAEETCTHE